MPSFNIKTKVCSISSVKQHKEQAGVQAGCEPARLSRPAGRAARRLAWSSAARAYPCPASEQWRS